MQEVTEFHDKESFTLEGENVTGTSFSSPTTNTPRSSFDHKIDEGESSEPFTDDKSNTEPEDVPVPYTRFGPRAKFGLVMQCAFTGFFSSIAGAIYYPVLTVIEKKFSITEEQVNITVVVYFIFQGLSPSLMGGLADSLGRRPVVLWSVVIYFGACIGLALSQNYTQIIILRCLQAAGISPVIAINSGIMGDVTTKAERGGYVGYVAGFQILGSALGALIGAALSSRWDWRAIFWFLAIGSGACALVSFFVLPETKRTVVGNGSIRPKPVFNRAPILLLPSFQKYLHLDSPDYDSMEPKVKINLLAPFSILKIPEIDLILFCAALQFALYTVHQTALSTVLSKDYGLSVMHIGLCYLPTGICTLLSVVTSGRYLNWAYRRRVNAHNKWLKQKEIELLETHKNDAKKVKDILETDPYYAFNLFRARLQPAFVTLVISSSSFIAFGWCLKVKAPLAAVLVTSGFASLFSNCILTFSTTLIVDLFPSKASTGTSCLNLFRCLLSAIYIACLSKMAIKMTYGGAFTFFGSLTGLSSFLLFIPMRKGKQITLRRRQEEQQAMEQYKREREKAMVKV
ncbi:hypothetical protein KAFR_0J01620 [Kazachstania africana CBS 2517]|uniref:Major facilitator superfamily (MFS) profile domain-containing protein n=1 Tax=Kazachstania africana (strain ATCC 22294 / BCRC 22015 / CBS 2517 / CECT 1963 / NBRC 1671 / NRRL Y-8276) TaxID=1071382 RepID=H2B0S7_KAZAF|nr:hypothetical protein KAFR_0J01620 [Kazachstania africana CBS 2517]CCF60227.1 hypothetical protein KAFR_0J01620 [Kazachstania africana CBS 2517]